MSTVRFGEQSAPRRGVVLLVVITLLTLFAVVGIAFVVFAQAEATASRISREVETMQQPDMDPEMLLAYCLNQLIFGVNSKTNPNSQLLYQSLGENMYGVTNPIAGSNTTAFNGTGVPNGYSQMDMSKTGPPPNCSLNPPYTYPDMNARFLAAVRPSDGAVLVPSFWRNQGAIQLRATGLPQPEDGPNLGDVKNLPDSPGLLNSTTGAFTPNDSIWTDLGFPVMYAPDGRQFKPLFAFLIQDLDNRINVNAHGNSLSQVNAGSWPTWCVSHSGWSPGEVSLDRVLTGSGMEAQYIFKGQPSSNVTGRYQTGLALSLGNKYCPGGHFYSGTDIDGNANTGPTAMVMPAAGTGGAFPYYNANVYGNSWWNATDKTWNPTSWNYFDPTQNWYTNGATKQAQTGRRFPVSNIEALLRYGDRGSPALRSDLFALCPNSFQTAMTRRQVTTLSMDLARAGISPGVFTPGLYALNAGQSYPTLQPVTSSGSSGLDTQTVLNRINLNRGFVDYSPVQANAGFAAGNKDANFTGWQSAATPWMPSPTMLGGPAMKSRQLMCQEVFNVLCTVTGAQQPTSATSPKPGTPQFDAVRWLAQLAVNIVDFTSYPTTASKSATKLAPDDVITMFNWNPYYTTTAGTGTNKGNGIHKGYPIGWVFGTILPRLVINEVYVEVANTAADTAKMPPPQQVQSLDVNCWVELHNPFPTQPANAIPTPSAANSNIARLYYPGAGGTNGYAGYRLIIAQTTPATPPANANANNTNNTQVLGANTTTLANSNVLGVPVNIQAIVDTYTPDPSATPAPALTGDSLNQVLPVQTNGGTNGKNTITNSTAGGNQGFYVLGPKTAFPGTSSLKTLKTFFATLPVEEEKAQTASDPTLNWTPTSPNASNSMHYTLQGATIPQGLTHTIVLQRLACPYLPPQPDVTQIQSQGYYNPYVTVDYVPNVPINNAVSLPAATAKPTPVAQRFSTGRAEPYSATQQIPQQVSYNETKLNTSLPPPTSKNAKTPQNTFFCMNVQNAQNSISASPYDWPFFANRWLISPGELLHVSGYKPHQFTQMFQGAQKFGHRAPWFDSSASIYRALEFFEAGLRPQWSPIGGRFPGRININTIWDLPAASTSPPSPPQVPNTFMALCDPQSNNFFTQQAVYNAYMKMLMSRTPNGVPGTSDRPFRSLAAAYAQAGGPYGANGSTIDDTFLRSDPTDQTPNPAQKRRLFETNPSQGGAPITPQPAAPYNAAPYNAQQITLPEMNMDPNTGKALNNPYCNYEMLTKMWGNVTTRSNVFAVWVTVGFFQVNGSSLTEIGRSENRQVRHRMFAVVDRTNLVTAIAPNATGSTSYSRPFFVNAGAVSQAGTSATTGGVMQAGQQATVTVSCSGSNMYEELPWNLSSGSVLVDPGPNQEIVAITGSGTGPVTFTATFTKMHPPGFAISGAMNSTGQVIPVMLGNPGPQTTFDPRNPQYNGVVRYFTLIE